MGTIETSKNHPLGGGNPQAPMIKFIILKSTCIEMVVTKAGRGHIFLGGRVGRDIKIKKSFKKIQFL